MKIIKKALPKNYTLVVSSDLHLGSPCVNEDHIAQMVDDVCSTRHTYMTNLGDNIEAISPNDKRFQFSNCKYQTSKDQADAVIRLFKPMGDKLLAIGHGNHEAKMDNDFKLSEYISEQLGVPCGGISYILSVYNDSTMKHAHNMYFHHGAGSISSNAKDDIQAEANMKATLKNRLARTPHSDCIVMGMGHIHRSLIVKPTSQNKLHFTAEDGRVKQHYRIDEPQNVSYIAPDSRFYFANSSFMKLYCDSDENYNGYAEKFMLSATEIGYTKIHVEDSKVVDIEFIRI